MYQLVKWYIDI